LGVHQVKRGLDLPITGQPEAIVEDGRPVTRVGLVAQDYIALRAKIPVEQGTRVKRGQLLFEHRKIPGLRFTSPAAGEIAAINRGEARALESLIIRVDESGDEASDNVRFESHTGKHPSELDAAAVGALLKESGLMTAFRARPFGKIPPPESVPLAIFVTAIDTNPLAPPLELVIRGHEEDFDVGLAALAKLPSSGKVFVCKRQGSPIASGTKVPVQVEEFNGPHPSGTPGLHIHLLAPVNRERVVWHLGLQDVIAIGHLFRTGRLRVDWTVSLAGPQVTRPRLLRTRLGAELRGLVEGELKEGENRIISGSVFAGRMMLGESDGFLGRHHQQVTVLRESRERELFGWLKPGTDRFSTIPVFLSKFIPGRKFDFTTTTYGSERAIVPIGMYERVMAFDILPTFLLRALVMRDVETAEALGCLELDEEDVALLTFVCPGKTDYGLMLRDVLTLIEEEK
jgi:Na+-transporting NADH:ubiquinone oxidoreductase subunit A